MKNNTEEKRSKNYEIGIAILAVTSGMFFILVIFSPARAFVILPIIWLLLVGAFALIPELKQKFINLWEQATILISIFVLAYITYIFETLLFYGTDTQALVVADSFFNDYGKSLFFAWVAVFSVRPFVEGITFIVDKVLCKKLCPYRLREETTNPQQTAMEEEKQSDVNDVSRGGKDV